MRASGRASWIYFNRDLEGRFHWPYLDIFGLLTTGVGNLCDEWSTFRALPWTHKIHCGPATEGEMREEYSRVKANFCGRKGAVRCAWEESGKGLCMAHAGAWGLGPRTFLRVSDESIDAHIMRVLDLKIEQMRQDYKDWDAWPADAQMGTMSLCWAMGTEFVVKYGFTNFDRAVRRRDWRAAELSCGMSSVGNPGVIERNSRNRLCFRNAAASVSYGVDPEVLHWPNALTLAPADGAETQPTLPELPDPPETLPELDGPQGTAEGLAEWAIEQHRRDRGES